LLFGVQFHDFLIECSCICS